MGKVDPNWNGRGKFLMTNWLTSRTCWIRKISKQTCQRSSRGSTNLLGNNSVIFQGVTIRITLCTNWPPKLMTHIEAKCGSLASTPDFFDVIGQVSWFED